MPPAEGIGLLDHSLQLTHDVIEYYFRLETPPKIDFRAGQFITFKVPAGEGKTTPRSYSIASPPYLEGEFVLCVKLIPGGKASTWFGTLAPGTKVPFRGPVGKFVLDNAAEADHLLFVGTGTGVAPLRAMILDLLRKGEKKRLTLYFGVRHIADVFYLDEFKALKEKHPNFDFVVTLSRPENDSWTGPKGRVTDLVQALPDVKGLEVYICGSNDMIQEVKAVLLGKGINEDRVRYEKFY